MLVVVEYRYVELLLEPGFNFKAGRRGDVFQVDAAKGGFQQFYSADDFLGVSGIQADGKGVDAGKGLEQHRFALHNRHGRLRSDVPQAQYRRPVGNHGDKIAFGGILIYRVFVFMYFQTRFRHSGGIGQAQIPGIAQGNLAADCQFSPVVSVEL